MSRQRKAAQVLVSDREIATVAYARREMSADCSEQSFAKVPMRCVVIRSNETLPAKRVFVTQAAHRWVFLLVLGCGCSPSPGENPSEMVEVPAGPFVRGCDDDQVFVLRGTNCERGEDFIAQDVPRREVHISRFWIDRYETTIGEYIACVDAGGCEPISTIAPPDVEPRDRIAINGVNWFQALAYCRWRGKRLPTEAEWEKAGRGPQGWEMPWGDFINERACGYANTHLNHPLGCEEHPRRVDLVDANPSDRSGYGVVGMAGNVQEWVQDWAHYDYYAWSEDRDPAGPESSTGVIPIRVVRGGYYDGFARLSLRRWLPPGTNEFRMGVRCASSVDPARLSDPLASQ